MTTSALCNLFIAISIHSDPSLSQGVNQPHLDDSIIVDVYLSSSRLNIHSWSPSILLLVLPIDNFIPSTFIMTLVRITNNKTLKGHKAVIFSTVEPPKAQIDAIQKQFPDLTIKTFIQPWGAPLDPSFKEEEWQDTTVLLTATLLPKPEQAPHLQYVQLTSAGANHLIKDPLFTDTKIPFSTANGVHGWVGLARWKTIANW